MQDYSSFDSTSQLPFGGGSTRAPPLIRPPSWRTSVHATLNRPSASATGRIVRAATLALILLSTACFVLQSVPSLAEWSGWEWIDVIVAVVFTVEYALRMYVAPDGRGAEENDDELTLVSAPSARTFDVRSACSRAFFKF